jgi:hypothetical protein
VLGVRNDGDVDLAIVASGPLDASADTLHRLDRKIRGYIAEVGSMAFREESSGAVPGKIRIMVVCEHAVDMAAQGLIEALKPAALANGATLELTDSAVQSGFGASA